MGRSLRIASVRGIEVRVHMTFPLILIWAALNWGAGSFFGWRGAVYGVTLVLLLFVCVVLHELGHSLMAMHYGVRVKDITLLPIGGVAQLRRMPAKPHQELLVALAGPAVNVGIAILLAAVYYLAVQGHIPPAFRIIRTALRPGLNGILVYLLLANAGMAVFNMIPALPMDGGRVLRALLAMFAGHVRATLIAARVGQAVAAAFIALAIAPAFMGDDSGIPISPMPLIIGLFVFTGAAQELRVAKLRRVLDGITAGQAVDPTVLPALEPEQPLGSVTQLAILHRDPDFPVMRDGRLVGLLHSADLNLAMREHGPWAPVSDAMRPLPVEAKASDSLYDVQQLLAEHEADAATINDENGFFRGILTRQRIAALWASSAARS